MHRLPFCTRWMQGPSHWSCQNRRKCSRAGNRCESVRSLFPPNLAGRGEQTHVAPDEDVVFEIGLEMFEGYLSSVHVHCKEGDGVVLGVKWILVVRTVVRIVIDAAQHQTSDGMVQMNMFSCVCDRALAGMEYSLQLMDPIGYFIVLFSRALMCAICTVGFRVAFLQTQWH